jgi:hypothetical protein
MKDGTRYEVTWPIFDV